MKNYLLLNVFDENINIEILENLHQYKNIHINIYNESHKETILSLIKKHLDFKLQNVFLYSFSYSDVLLAEKYNINIHYCFNYDNILIEDSFYFHMKKNIQSELFLFIDNINFNKEKVINRLALLNRPICFYTTGILTNSYSNNYEELRQTILFINRQFKNPLFEIESVLELDDFQINYYIEQKNNIIYNYELILGIHGDVVINALDIDNFQKDNYKSLIKLKECVSCSFFNTCKNKGIGYTIKKLDLKGCNSYKIIYGK